MSRERNRDLETPDSSVIIEVIVVTFIGDEIKARSFPFFVV